jgi:hypothetical protein
MPCFDRQFQRLSERLLTAGIAPRHVHRYVRELGDHFDDLMREETANGVARELAETQALSRLGSEEDLAQAMLSRPALRSLTARFPWAVFGLGPVAMLILSVVAALQIEIWLIELATAWGPAIGLHPGPAAARGFTLAMLVWNTLAVYAAPLAFAALLYLIGSRQRMRPVWIVTGVAIICVLGGFQNLVFYDTGVRGGGVLLIQSGLISPFWHFVDDGFFTPFNFAEGLARVAMNLAIAGGVWWWLTARKKAPTAIGLHTART